MLEKNKNLSFLKFILFFGIVGCGDQGTGISTFSFNYYLENPASNSPQNKLIFQYPEGAGYKVKINGDQVFGDFEQNQEFNIRQEVNVYADSYGEYDIRIQVYYEDNSLFIDDTIKWQYSNETPEEPIVSFSERATNDGSVSLQISSSRGPHTNEIWVQGDLLDLESQKGSWIKIPTTHVVPIVLSEGEGVKEIQVKLKNIFGNETEVKELKILRKESIPTGCKIEIFSSVVKNNIAEVKVSGKSQGPMLLTYFGDVIDEFKEVEFEGSKKLSIALTEGNSDKEVTFLIRDIAENTCFREKKIFKIDKNFHLSPLSIVGQNLWTDEQDIELKISFEYFENEKLEMYVYGGVENSEYTNKWIEKRDQIPLHLNPASGHRIIRVKFRVKGGKEIGEYDTQIYLRPFIILYGASLPYFIGLSHIQGLVSVTIEGCQEVYQKVSFSNAYRCTPKGKEIKALYYLNDNQVLVISYFLKEH